MTKINGYNSKKKTKKPNLISDLSGSGIIQVSCGGNHSAAVTGTTNYFH